MSMNDQKPPFDPKKKNNAVDFGKPKVVNAIKAQTLSTKGVNRTKNSYGKNS